MTILQKGPYTRKEYKEYRDELYDQIFELERDTENREFLSVAFLIPAGICFMTLLLSGLVALFMCGFQISPSTNTTPPNSVIISITIIIVDAVCVGVYYLLCINPYKNQLKQLKNEKG